MPSSKRFEGKTAFITGAASGIGRATAVAFAVEGANVVVTDRSEAALHKAAELVKAAGAEVLAVTCDVSKPKSSRQSHRQSKPSAASTAPSTTPASRTKQPRFTKSSYKSGIASSISTFAAPSSA